jgi:methylthioribulose-1-phosphate dehydratase
MTQKNCVLSPDTVELRRQLVVLAHRYHQMGWLLGTCGNLSARAVIEGKQCVVVTASGKDKRLLTESDFVEVASDGALLTANNGDRPSAETSIHLALYDTHPEANVVLHVHTPASTVLNPSSTLPSVIKLTGFEMLKGWNLWDEHVTAELPMFPNHAHVPRIADDVRHWYDKPSRVPAMVIKGHGITSWGADFFDANRHLEVTEFLCNTLVQTTHQLSSNPTDKK